MKQELRTRIILDLLKETDSVTIQEIAWACQVSEITIRRDLNDLEEKGLLIRTHGGAIRSEAVTNLFSFDNRLKRNRDKKIRVCQTASGFIKRGDIIFVDCGSTLFYLSRYVKNIRDLKIITNSLPLISELINYPGIRITMIGGDVVSERRAIYGSAAERSIKGYHAHKAFIGADGVSLKKGLSSYDDKESAITGSMIENADEVYLLCDSTKLERDSFIRFAPLSTIDHLITDPDVNPEIRKEYVKNTVDIIT